jgi:hypothetical protein
MNGNEAQLAARRKDISLLSVERIQELIGLIDEALLDRPKTISDGRVSQRSFVASRLIAPEIITVH